MNQPKQSPMIRAEFRNPDGSFTDQIPFFYILKVNTGSYDEFGSSVRDIRIEGKDELKRAVMAFSDTNSTFTDSDGEMIKSKSMHSLIIDKKRLYRWFIENARHIDNKIDSEDQVAKRASLIYKAFMSSI